MVRLSSVFCPSNTRVGGVFSLASLAKAAICGWDTQFGTRISSRLLSYVTACVLPNFRDTLFAGALRIVRRGATSPVAVNEYAVAEALPRLATHSSWFFTSTARLDG